MQTLIKKSLITILLLITTSVFAADTLFDNRLKDWQEKAGKGNARAQYSLGNAYLKGTEVDVDINKAISWFKAAAKQGHAKSEYKLGYLYYSGKGVSRNYRTAADWLKRAAKRDYAPAQFFLGKLHASGRGVNKSYKDALAWLNKAKDGGYAPAAREIRNVKDDMREAEEAPQQVAVYTPPKPTPPPAPKPRTVSRPKSVAPAARKSAPKPVVTAKVTAPEPAPAARKPKKGPEADLINGNWVDSKGNPAENLPSSVNKCSLVGSGIKCRTNELGYSNPFAEVSYMVESHFGKFQSKRGKGQFMSKNRTKILFVLPADPDDTSIDVEDVPETGWKSTTILRCKFKNKRSITCLNDNFEKETFTRK